MIALPILLLSLACAPSALATPSAAAGAPANSPEPGVPGTQASPIAPPANPVPSATASAMPSTSPGLACPQPVPTSLPSPAVQPSAIASETPSPYKYRFVPHRSASVQPGQPIIVAVYLNSQKLRSEGPILIKVQTNEAVVKVVSRSNGREGGIPRVAEGDFEAASKLPKLPFIASGMTIDLEFVATSADGRKTSVRVPVKLN